jgi:23S rRNA (guanosine2251-2'-O)-methyltransferase
MRHQRSSPHLASASAPPRKGGNVLCGINAIQEALRVRARRLEAIWVGERKQGRRLRQVMDRAAEQAIPIEIVADPRLTEAAGTTTHQGIVAFVASTPLLTLDQLIARVTAQRPISPLVMLDGVKDPRNLGAVIRSAAAFGIGGVIVPERRAAGITATVAKAAAGGLEHVAVAGVTNISQSIERLKRQEFWVVGADEQTQLPCQTFVFPSPVALVFGEEGSGLSPLVKRHCDALVSIPVRGPLRSLNVAVAAAVLFYEVVRQGLREPIAAGTAVLKRSSQ